MPRLTSDSAILRPGLGSVVREHMERESELMGYIGLQVMPLFPVRYQSGTYKVIPKEALLGIEDTKRAPRGKYSRSDYEYESGYYSTVEHGREEAVDDVERADMDIDAAALAETLATERATNTILRGQEKRISDIVFNSSNFTAHPVTNEWDDAANATPIDDVGTGKISVRSACGMLPNTLIISYSTYLKLKRCAQIVDLIKYTFPGLDINKLSTVQLAQVLDVPQVLVGGAVYDSAKKGQSASITDLWSNEYAMLTRISGGGDIMTPCIGRTFLWTEDSENNNVVELYREEQTRGDIIRVRHNVSEALIASRDSSGTIKSNISAACSYLMSNITT